MVSFVDVCVYTLCVSSIKAAFLILCVCVINLCVCSINSFCVPIGKKIVERKRDECVCLCVSSVWVCVCAFIKRLYIFLPVRCGLLYSPVFAARHVLHTDSRLPSTDFVGLAVSPRVFSEAEIQATNVRMSVWLWLGSSVVAAYDSISIVRFESDRRWTRPTCLSCFLA